MGFNLDGYVLRPARVATGNSQTTDEATTGVDRDHITPAKLTTLGYSVVPGTPVEPYADMYRAAVLLQPDSRAARQEYCLFASTTGSLSTLDDASVAITGGIPTMILGGLSVDGGTYNDGTLSLYLRDNGDRDIGTVTSVAFLKGGTQTVVVCPVTTFDPVSGRVDFSDPGDLNGGVSEERGDSYRAASYQLAGVSFWWTRNDAADGVRRFGWDGKLQKWLPLKGSGSLSLGAVKPDTGYTLTPPPSRFSVGDVLPYDGLTGDSYALVRAGLYSDGSSTPLNILVVTDEQAGAGSWDALWTVYDAVVGVTSGFLFLNPTTGAFTEVNSGLTLWYNAETFTADANGDLGAVADLPTTTNQGFPSMSPVPGATERPFLRIGNRTYLTPVPKANDVALDDPIAVAAGSFQWSRTTGKVVLSKDDLDRCTPGEALYEIPYLGARLYYDGVALSTQPIPVKAASAVLDNSGNPLDGNPETVPSVGNLYVQRAVCMPPPGVSGVTWIPDGSGSSPNTALDPQTRPNGSGMIREIKGEAGDSFFFGSEYAYEDLDVIEYDEDLPALKIKVPKTTVVVSRMEDSPPVANASRIQLRRRPVRGDALYFRQSMVIPSVYSEEARLYARFAEPYVLGVGDTLRYALNSVVYTWTNSLGVGSFTAAQVAATFPVGHAGVERGRLYLEDASNTDIEVGWNNNQRDFTGHAALGLLPGWRVVPGNSAYRWLPDNGSAMGVFRSPVNLDRSESTPDIRSRSSYDDELLTESIPAVPFTTVFQYPLEDLPGYAEDSHFRVKVGLLQINLKNYQVSAGVGLHYEWQDDRFAWITDGSTSTKEIPYPTAVLQMDDIGLLPETVSSAAMLNGSFGLDFKDAQELTFNELELGLDYLMPSNGQPGQAVLVSVEGREVTAGGKGTFAFGSTSFTDPNVSDQTGFYNAVEVGYLLEILGGEAQGVYRITAKAPTDPTEITVFPAFIASSATAQWRVYEAKPRSEIDGTLLADVQLVETNHLNEEPFKIRALTAAGTVNVSPLVVNPVDARRSNREVSLRFGLSAGSFEATPSYLVGGALLGVVIASGLGVDISDPHVSTSVPGTAYFQIRIGAQAFSTALGNLTVDVGTAPVGGVDVDVTTGAVLIDSTVVSDLVGSRVYFDQLFLAPSSLASGACEIDPGDGRVNISAADATAHADKIAYFVEQMVTEDNLDVTLSPLNGGILFNKPLVAGQVVEVNYFQADTSGDKALDADGNYIEITEFLPLVVRLEEATRVDDYTYTYNPTGRTLSEAVEPFVWVGVNLQNFAGFVTASVSGGVITFTEAVDASEEVKINYGVLEAFGGEQAYTVSSAPVYRKPFWLNVGQSTFALDGDRSGDFPVGSLLRLGPVPLYIDSVVYDVGEDTTTVGIFPPPQAEAGSRAVGRDVPLSVSDFIVSVSRGGAEGFMPLLDTVTTPLLPVDRGQLKVSFYGDVRQYMRADHLLEINGYPYLVVNATLSDDGLNTVVDIATPAYQAHDNTQLVRISVRPVYSPAPVNFTGLGAFVDTEEFALILLGSTDSGGDLLPGQVLTEGVHYTVDAGTGGVAFQSPTQGALKRGEYLHFRHTRLDEVSPAIANGALLYPLYKAQYLHLTTPSLSNYLLGSNLRAKYTYRDQDSFYYEVLPLIDYLPQVSEKSSAMGVNPIGGGAVPTFGGEVVLYKQGRLGLRGEVRDFQNQDQAGRRYIELFNGVVLAFEQVLEALDGRVIGDRDGKFRFFVGHNKQYTAPGYEDDITGDLNERLVWREVINAWAPDGFSGWFTEADAIFDPTTAQLKDATNLPQKTDGKTPNPETLAVFTGKQRNRVKNDMDDVVLMGFGRPKGRGSLFPWVDVPGLFKQMWEAHRFSRLFPEQTKHFTRLYPGLEATLGATGFSDPGFYTAGRKITVPGPRPGETTEQTVKTRGGTIGTVTNPALGVIENIVDVTAVDRLPRARVWAYYPEGSADLDTALGTATVGKATLVATPLTLGRFPVDPSTGFPDSGELISNGGALADLESGDFDLATPAFRVGQRINYGLPESITYVLTDTSGDGIYIGSVQQGCVLTLVDVNGAAINGSDVLVNTTEPLGNVISALSGYGDTVFVGRPIVDLSSLPSPTDPLTLEENEKIREFIPDYRIQFDLKVDKRKGEFLDASLSTEDDVFPVDLQKWLNQNPPQPLTCLEGEAFLINTSSSPVRLPCLLGEDKDDSGDYQIPYIRSTNTELAVLGRVAASIELLYVDSTGTTPVPMGLPTQDQQDWLAVYPDEILVSDGTFYETATYTGYPLNPATLYTSEDLRPVPTGGYVANSGVGDARRFDLVFVQAPQPTASMSGARTGILSVGAVQTDLDVAGGASSLEVPRFVTPCAVGNTHKYTVRGFSSYVDTKEANNGSGVATTETVPGVRRVAWDFSSVSGYDHTGLAGLVGSGNALVIRYYDPNAGLVGDAFIGAVVIPSNAPLGVLYVWNQSTTTATPVTLDAAGTGLTFPTATSIQAEVQAASSILTLLGITGGASYDFSLDLDTYIDPVTNSYTAGALTPAPGSTTCGVQRNRLTFQEELGFQLAKPRNYTPANSNNGSGTPRYLRAALALHEIEIGGVTGYTVNSPKEINGAPGPGELGFGFGYLTFLERLDSSAVPYVGTFSGATGTLRLMSWEGFGNAPLTDISGVVLSTAPSSDLNETTQIMSAQATLPDGDSSVTPQALPGALRLEGNRNYLYDFTLAAGGLANVERGDLLVVDSTTTSLTGGAVKVGSYLIRHRVEGDGATQTDATSVFGAVNVNAITQPTSGVPFATGGVNGPVDLRFPTVTDVVAPTALVSGSVTLSGVHPVAGSSTGHGWASTGRVYVILKERYCTYDATTTRWVVDPDSVYSIPYTATSYTEATETLILTIGAGLLSFVKADGTVTVGLSGIFNAAVGKQASGMQYLAVNQLAEDLPENNLFGADKINDGGVINLMGGFRRLSIRNMLPAIVNPALANSEVLASKTFSTDTSTLVNDIMGAPDTNDMVVSVPVPGDNTTFYADKRQSVYGRIYDPAGDEDTAVAGVADHFDTSNFNTAYTDAWFDIRFGTAAGRDAYNPSGTLLSATARQLEGLACILPGDRVTLGSTLDPATALPGMYALEGIFLEPSFPRVATNLSLSVPTVVDATNTLTAGLIGPRDVFGLLTSAPGLVSETVRFFVRRVRRWHDAQQEVVSGLSPLQYAYEIRRGEVSSYTGTSREFVAGTVTYGSATNLGPFTDEDVNINAGDVLRVIRISDGALFDTAEIERIQDSTTMILSRPGLDADVEANPGNYTFEVYLEQPIVPHEQSNEQLLELLTDKVIYERRVAYSGVEDGGQVITVNQMQDSGVTSWSAVGVQEGDYIVVDPAGGLYLSSERGARPVGDQSVIERAVPPYIGGRPSKLDDNRGFYKVTAVDDPAAGVLSVDGASRFSEGSPYAGDSGAEYVVLPTIHASLIPEGAEENQQDLRVTAAAGTGDSYQARTGADEYRSIEPFGYRVIRPNPVFSEDATELILFMRERMLSWVEEVSGVYNKGGDYYVFQRDEHIRDVGSSTDPLAGLGVVGNLVAENLIGLTGVTPFANTSDCLSLLDRRFWILDARLDALGYTQFATDGFEQRPVLPDLIEEVLDLDDRFREQRYAWINYRANRTNGSVQTALQSESSLDSRLEMQREAISRQVALDES